jgi:RNA polymerase sigma factor (sigma-70 family)
VGELSTDLATFEQVFLAEYGGLARLAAIICRDPARAEELVQEAFAAALPRWADLDRPGAFVQRTVINLAINARQRGRFTRQSPMDGIDTAVSDPEPADDALRAVLAGLPAVQRAVVALRFYRDLPLAEIAALLDRPLNTVKSDLRRALAALSEEIGR